MLKALSFRYFDHARAGFQNEVPFDDKNYSILGGYISGTAISRIVYIFTSHRLSDCLHCCFAEYGHCK